MAKITMEDDYTVQILMAPPVEWSAKFEALHDGQQAALLGMLDGLIERAARLRGYVDARYTFGTDKGHAAGVDSGNKLTRKVRKAMGFHYTQDISF